MAGCGPQPTEPRLSRCSLSRGMPPRTSPTGRRQSPGAPAASCRQSLAAAREAAVRQAELEQQRAIDRYRPFLQVAAVSIAPKSHGPDPFGLGRHLDEQARRASPARTPRQQQMMTPRRH